jgi:hypothetical protein
MARVCFLNERRVLAEHSRGTYSAVCRDTTFDRMRRSEVTTAAHVSSAEDSSPSTVKHRRVWCIRRTGSARRMRPSMDQDSDSAARQDACATPGDALT